METYDWKKITAAYLLSLGVGLAVTLCMGMVFAALIGGQSLSENSLGYGAMASVFVGAAVAAFLSTGRIKVLRLPISVGAGVVFLLGLMLCGWLLFGRVHSGILPTAALCLGAGLVVGLLGRKGSGRPKYKVPKSRY